MAAAGHGHVEVLSGHAGGGQDVGAVDGDALGAVGGRGVAEVPQTHSPLVVRVYAALA